MWVPSWVTYNLSRSKVIRKGSCKTCLLGLVTAALLRSCNASKWVIHSMFGINKRRVRDIVMIRAAEYGAAALSLMSNTIEQLHIQPTVPSRDRNLAFTNTALTNSYTKERKSRKKKLVAWSARTAKFGWHKIWLTDFSCMSVISFFWRLEFWIFHEYNLWPF